MVEKRTFDPAQPSQPSRRTALQAGAIGLMGLGMAELTAAQALGSSGTPRARSVILVFLTGGLSHLDSFDLKPDAPDNVRGEFQSIAKAKKGTSYITNVMHVVPGP